MSIFNQLKTTNGIQAQITPIDEKKKLASLALKRVDQYIKSKEFQKALLELANVKEIDPKNVYALAFEERIKTLQKENEHIQENAQKQKQETDTTLKRNSSVMAQPANLSTNYSNEPASVHSFNITNTSDSQNISKNSFNAPSAPSSNHIQIERKPKVVIIDDDVTLLSVLSMTIESGGFDVISLSTSDEAYMLLKKLVPDIIICDINLETSTMGGFSFFEKVHQIESIKNVPFIFLSGLSDEVLIRTGKEMGVDDYLTKPIKEQNLLAAIRGRIKRFEELGISSSYKSASINRSFAIS